MEEESIEEGMGESSSPPRAIGLNDVKAEIYNRLVEIGNEEVSSIRDLKEELDAHFSRLPARYNLCGYFAL